MRHLKLGLLGAIALTCLTVPLLLQAKGEPPDLDAAHRKAMQQRCAGSVRMALENYATDHRGSYPTQAGLAALLTPPGRADAGWPHNPWSQSPGPVPIVSGAWPRGLPDVQAVCVKGTHVTTPLVGRDLGPGHPPGSGPVDALTYGSILYSYDAATGTYVLYGIGKTGERATVVFFTSNCSG